MLLNGASDDALSLAQYRSAKDHDKLVAQVKKAAKAAADTVTYGGHHVSGRVRPTTGRFRRLRTRTVKVQQLPHTSKPLWRGDDGNLYLGCGWSNRSVKGVFHYHEYWQLASVSGYSVKALESLLYELETLIPSTSDLYWGDGSPEH